MSNHINKIVSMLDTLALKAETEGDMVLASRLDAISQLVVTADETMAETVALLAADLQKYFPLSTEQALTVAKELHTQYAEKGEEKESIFPTSALPNKTRKEGPRPQDVPIGTTQWWPE